MLTQKLQTFANLVHQETADRYRKQYQNLDAEREAQITIKPGKKYTKIDVGRSGKYMVTNDTGEIYGIKAYGVIHKGKRYGTLDTIHDYYWGDYAPTLRLIKG